MCIYSWVSEVHNVNVTLREHQLLRNHLTFLKGFHISYFHTLKSIPCFIRFYQGRKHSHYKGKKILSFCFATIFHSISKR